MPVTYKRERMNAPGAAEGFDADPLRQWRPAVLHALPVSGLILSLFTRWFAVADRYIVFLYNHDMGPLYPDTAPFSRVTSSRYWMAGLVASGAVLLLYTAAIFLLGRLIATYHPPAWRRVWGVCALILLIGVPAITMTVNEPTLPAGNAAQVTLITLVGVGLALTPGELVAGRPGELLWLTADGFGLALVLGNLIHVEKLDRWLARGGTVWVRMMFVSLAAGVLWLLFLTGLGAWRRRPVPRAGALLLAGLSIAYLFWPLLHHVAGTDGYYYISDSDNFFAQSAAVQFGTWLVSAGLVLGLTWLRQRVTQGKQSPL